MNKEDKKLLIQLNLGITAIIIFAALLSYAIYLKYPSSLKCIVYGEVDGEIVPSGFQCMDIAMVRYLNYPADACIVDREECP